MSATPGEANPVRAFVAQLWGSVFRHGLPTNDKVAARTALTNFFLHIHPVRVKKSAVRVSYTLCLGGLSFFLFILLTITGLFLMFYYIPSVDSAYQNVKDLQFVAVFGDIIRNMHRWAAHAMVITVWLHMARVFYQGAYKPPPVLLQDEFTSKPVSARVSAVPAELCMPTEKIAGGTIFPIIHPAGSLLCFPVTATPHPAAVFDQNQFGTAKLAIGLTHWLCPPSTWHINF